MTMPANNIPPPDPEELPPPELRLVVTDNLDPENTTNSKGPTVHWITGKQHPFMPSMNVECMFVSRNAVAIYVYSQSKDGKMGSRDVIPMSRVRLAHERMVPRFWAKRSATLRKGKIPTCTKTTMTTATRTIPSVTQRSRRHRQSSRPENLVEGDPRAHGES